MHQYCWRWRRSFYSFFFIYVRIHFKNVPNCKQTRVVRMPTFNTQVTQFSWMLTRKIITLHIFGTASDLKWKNMFVSNRVRTKNIFNQLFVWFMNEIFRLWNFLLVVQDESFQNLTLIQIIVVYLHDLYGRCSKCVKNI